MTRKRFLGLSHCLVLAIILVSLLMVLIPASVVKADSVVTFPDPGLEEAIRAAIDKPSGDIFESDLIGLTQLHADGYSITNLAGLEHCTGLTSLDLTWNEISDISPLASLSALTELTLDGNQVSDISPLAGLTGLTRLDLQYNQISDISPLAGLTGLTELVLYVNQIGDISPLVSLLSLTELDLGNNEISDISSLASLGNLMRLSLYGNQISDISPITGLTNLTQLSVGYNQISNISPLSGLTGLDSLEIGGSQIIDISPLAGLTSLTELSLYGDQISDISPIAGLTNLTQLEVGYNQISNISPLTSLGNLMYLELDGNQISDISPLSGLTNLTELYLTQNQISDISPLASLISLVDLYLRENQISDVSPLASLANLTTLELMQNQISDISPLASLTELNYLDLAGNQISDIEPLVDNSGVESGDFVDLQGNPLDSTSIDTWIPALQARGVEVHWDGVNQSPNQPGNVSPANAATDVSLTPTLQSSAFSDPDSSDTHAASQWQITTTAGDYSSPVFDSNPDASHLTGITTPSLNYATTYYWHVRHQDNHGVWSSWSSETSFTTASASPANQSPSQPGNVSPSNAATGVSLTAALQSSGFSDPDSGDTHAASQWQVTTTAGNYTSPVFDSNTDPSHLTDLTTPSLNYSTTYYWHVRHQDNHGAWSGWSTETSFTTAAAPPPANQSPNQPGHVSPSNAATSVSVTPTLQSSAFSDPDAGDTHGTSQWQISTTAGSYSSPVFDSSTDTLHLISINAPSLNYSTTYYWHMRYQDNHGAWSSWSSETSFTTLAATSAKQEIPAQGGKVETGDGRIAADFPTGAVATTTTVTIKQVEPSSAAAPKGFKIGNTFFTIEAVDADGNAIVTLSQPVAITVRYSDEDVATAGGDPSNLVLAYYDEAAAEWKPLDTSVNTSDRTLSATTTHLSTWVVLAKAAESKGTPFWIWIVVGGVAIAVVAVGLLMWRRVVKKRVPAG
jgi:internalin A